MCHRDHLSKKEKLANPLVYELFGGELGIRTLGSLRNTTFRVSHLRPLGQLSIYVHLGFTKNAKLQKEIQKVELQGRTAKYSVFEPALNP